MVQCVEEIYKFYKVADDENCLFNCMLSESHITEKMRMIFVDWLVKFMSNSNCWPRSYISAINIADQHLLRMGCLEEVALAANSEVSWNCELGNSNCHCDICWHAIRW